MTKVVFKKLHPFDVAFHESLTDTIFVDEKFKNSKALDWILKHEEGHSKLKGNMNHLRHDWKFDRDQFNVIGEILDKKPFFLIGMFVPVTYDIRNGKRIWGYDKVKLVNLILMISAVSILIYLKNYVL